MPDYEYVVHGLAAGTGRGYSLEATAVRLAHAITELRAEGGLPEHVETRTEINLRRRELVVRVWGLSPEDGPDRIQAHAVLQTLFELASFHNIVPLDSTVAPLFTQRILLLDHQQRPFAALVGAGLGDVEPLPAGAPWK